MLDRPRYIGSEIFRRSRYGAKHPLAIPRVSAVTDLVRALGWLPDEVYVDSPQASPDALARFHDPDYVAALMAAEAAQAAPPEVRARYGIGANGNPVFGEIFRRPATACGGTLAAVALLAEGGIVHSPAGGTHHGRPARASGFCYLNDPALGIMAMLDSGLGRVAYVDIDAHHGDGVEDAFADESRVLTLSVHEAGRWPHSGTHSDPARHIHNVPVPPEFHDDEMALVLEAAILPLIDAFAPEAILLQCGADGLAEDPLSKLALSNRSHRRVAAALMGCAPRLLVLGGGGYNPWAVARCWAGVWACLNGIELPARLPAPAEAVLRGLVWNRSAGRNPPEGWFTTLADAPRGGPIRDDVRDAVREAMRGF